MATAESTPPRQTLSGTFVLRALSCELSEVAEGCRDLDVIVAEMLSHLPEGHRVSELQAFDLLIQRLSATATVIARLADHLPLAQISAADVLHGVPLSGLKNRLSGEAALEARDGAGHAEIW